MARQYFDGSILQAPVALHIRQLESGLCELRYDTVRGLFYRLQFTPTLDSGFEDGAMPSVQAVDSLIVRTDPVLGKSGFYRLLQSSQR